MSLPTVDEPFPIFLTSRRYLLYDINIITYIRSEHHICGVLIGSLPQVPQQNVFLGIPLELMPEEVKHLVENGAAFVVDDAEWHNRNLSTLGQGEISAFVESLHLQGRVAARIAYREAEERQEKALKKLEAKRQLHNVADSKIQSETRTEVCADSSQFNHSSTSATGPESPAMNATAFGITPTCSYPPLPKPSTRATIQPLTTPRSYPLYAHLHSKGYYLSPGLRFGCQYLVYPGDPLRFHSHFLAVGAEWDDELDLVHLVGGGRLGTGVKKGFLIGGLEGGDAPETDSEANGKVKGRVRTFCIEWGGM